MANLISAQQVIDISFTNKNTNALLIKETMIDATQEKYLRPVLNKLYDILIVSPSTLEGANKTLYDNYIIQCLAFYVKYEILPDLCLTTSSKGVRITSDEFSNLATDKQRAELAEKTKDFAETLKDKMLHFLEDNITDYPDFKKGINITKKSNTFAGIILE